MTPLLADARGTIADYLGALVLVYTLIVFAWVIVSLLLSFGVRMPYNRGVDAVLTFLRDVVEPYLRIFRRILPPIGPLDLSPLVGIILLQVVGNIVVSAVRG